jgi:hypothetical protein
MKVFVRAKSGAEVTALQALTRLRWASSLAKITKTPILFVSFCKHQRRSNCMVLAPVQGFPSSLQDEFTFAALPDTGVSG